MDFVRPLDRRKAQQSTGKMDTDEAQAEAAVLGAINDIKVAQAFLDRPAWAGILQSWKPNLTSLGTWRKLRLHTWKQDCLYNSRSTAYHYTERG
jgi:hypothetical protein